MGQMQHGVGAAQADAQQPIVRVVVADAAIDHGLGILLEHKGQVAPQQGFLERPAGLHPAFLQHHQVIGQARHLVGRMADVEDRDIQLLVQAFQVGQHLQLALEVERGQRFVHQQQARAGQQGAGDGHALALAAGELVRHTLQQMADAEQLDRLLQRHPPAVGGDAFVAELQVAPHRQVGEQVGVLEHVTQCALVRRDEPAVCAVLPELAIDPQVTVAWMVEAGEAAQATGLARARVAEQRGDAAAGQGQLDIQGKAGVIDLETGVDNVVGVVGQRHVCAQGGGPGHCQACLLRRPE
ncbi:hypothetical protein D9M68_701500 [compost metagenome]